VDFYNKNILIILHTGVLGGAERQGLGIAKILTEKYNCKVFLLLTFSGKMNDDFEEFARHCHIIKTLHFGSPYLVIKKELSLKNIKRSVWSIKYLLRLRRNLIDYKFDIVIPFLNFPSKIAFYLYKLLPTVKFTFWHQLGLDTYSHDVLEYFAAKRVPCVIANASNGIDLYLEGYKVKPSKLNVLPQYISLDVKHKDGQVLRKKYDLAEDAIVIGMIAHFRDEKYHEFVLNSFYELSKRYTNIALVFLGQKSVNQVTLTKFNFLENKIDSLKLTDRVKLLTDQDVHDVLNIIDVGVLISRIEGMPNVVMEYMLYGLPVIATNHPGCIQLLEDSDFLIENDEINLINALDELIKSEEKRTSEGNRNLKRISKFDMNTYMHQLEGIMNKYA
jgi:glycosyltransferase involved in cell wall biosynthesis